MARRRRNDNWWVGPIAQLACFVAFACAFIPGVREMIVSLGIVALAILGIIAAGLIALVIYRLSNPERRMQPAGANAFPPPSQIPDPVRVAGKVEHAQPSRSLAAPELNEQLRSMDWFQFEKLIGHVYRKLGYAITRRGGANPDGGIDLIIEKDGQRTAVQCKQWKTWNVGVKVMREFLGALTDAGIQQGIVITLRGYTQEAKQFAEKHRIKIISEAGLGQMLESTDACFDPDVLELLHDTRKFCPKCERELVIRTARKGFNSGSRFWGCPGYPRCNFTMPIA